MVAAAILDFWPMWILTVILHDPVFSLRMKFGENICENGRVMAKSVIFNIPAAAILDFTVYQFCIYNQLWDPFSMCVSNLVWIRSKMSQLWPYNWFQNSGRRHLGFLHYVNFDGKSGCRTPFSAYVSNLVKILYKNGRLMAKSVIFNMAAAAILNLLPVTIFVIWSSLGSGCGCFCKIS